MLTIIRCSWYLFWGSSPSKNPSRMASTRTQFQTRLNPSRQQCLLDKNGQQKIMHYLTRTESSKSFPRNILADFKAWFIFRIHLIVTRSAFVFLLEQRVSADARKIYEKWRTNSKHIPQNIHQYLIQEILWLCCLMIVLPWDNYVAIM